MALLAMMRAVARAVVRPGRKILVARLTVVVLVLMKRLSHMMGAKDP